MRVNLLSLVSCFLICTESARFHEPGNALAQKREMFACASKKLKTLEEDQNKDVKLTEVNFLLALWALWHFVAAVCVNVVGENRGGILCVCSCTDWSTCLLWMTTPRCEVQMCAPSCIYSTEEIVFQFFLTRGERLVLCDCDCT